MSDISHDNERTAIEAARVLRDNIGMTVDEFVENAREVARLFGVDPNTIPVAEPHRDYGDEHQERS